MTQLPMDAGMEAIGQAVIQSLSGSQCNITESESVTQSQAALRLCGEQSWEDLESKYSLVRISTDTDCRDVDILTMRCSRKGRFVGFKGDPAFHVVGMPHDIGSTVRAIIDDDNSLRFTEESSHT